MQILSIKTRKTYSLNRGGPFTIRDNNKPLNYHGRTLMTEMDRLSSGKTKKDDFSDLIDMICMIVNADLVDQNTND